MIERLDDCRSAVPRRVPGSLDDIVAVARRNRNHETRNHAKLAEIARIISFDLGDALAVVPHAVDLVDHHDDLADA